MHFTEHFNNWSAHPPAAIRQHQMADGKGYTWVGQVTVLVANMVCTVLVGFKNFKLWELPLENNEFP